MRTIFLVALASIGFLSALRANAQPTMPTTLSTADGYRGIWYHVGDKYSGGFATYPQQIRPLAIYAPAVNKTFFVYGGTTQMGKQSLLHMISYYDHATGTVARPRILLDKKVTDAHDNPSLAIDDKGYIYIFSNTHGPENRSSIHRSSEPYSIDSFEDVFHGSFSYGDPWFVPGQGLLFVHNRYQDGRAIAFMTSEDGRSWSKPTLLSQIPKGHYSISGRYQQRIGIVFDYHPNGLDTRTNIYYIETSDFGKTWKTIDGTICETPLKSVKNPALIFDAESQKLLVYNKDIEYDAQGHPVILFLTSRDFNPGPKGNPRTWMTARWTGEKWVLLPVTTSDHNYDFGQLYIEADGTWRIIAPTDPGPQPGWTGGEIVEWLSKDQGATWQRGINVTSNSKVNQTFVREPIDARDDFYAFWADGDPTKPSPSSLYFTNKQGDKVWRLPTTMQSDMAKPDLIAQH